MGELCADCGHERTDHADDGGMCLDSPDCPCASFVLPYEGPPARNVFYRCGGCSAPLGPNDFEKCADCAEEFCRLCMDKGDPYQEGFCKACADDHREFERNRA